MESIDIINSETVKVIAQLVKELTELRLRNSPSLCIENFAPELFARLLFIYQEPERFLSQSDTEWYQMATGRREPLSDSN